MRSVKIQADRFDKGFDGAAEVSDGEMGATDSGSNASFIENFTGWWVSSDRRIYRPSDTVFLETCMQRRETLEQLSERFREADPPLVAFVGAGTSCAEPASYPLSREIPHILVDAVLAVLERPEWASRLHRTLSEAGLPLEYFSQIVVQVSDSRFPQFFSALRPPDSQPNTFHRFLAVAASKGLLEAIVTPNFDEFIEDALLAIGIRKAEHRKPSKAEHRLLPIQYFRVISSTAEFTKYSESGDLESLKQHSRPGDTIPILKLHGTISRPESILATVESYQSWFLRDQQRLFSLLFGVERPWLFVGYSGRDEIFEWLHPPEDVMRRQRKNYGPIFWQSRVGSGLAPPVQGFFERHGVARILGTADELAAELLASLGASAEELRCSHSQSDKVKEQAVEWFRGWSPMALHNLLGGLCLHLGRHSDAVEMIRAGLKTNRDSIAGLKGSRVRGLFFMARAKAYLGRRDLAVADATQAFMDWNQYRAQLLSDGLDEEQWGYTLAEIKLWSGFLHHQLDRSISDQITAWELMSEAETWLEEWHSRTYEQRNFESSPEYATLHWLKGLFMVKGGDLELARRFFSRIYDVDVFNAVPMKQTWHLFGPALVEEAEAMRAKGEPYHELVVRSHLKAAKTHATAALQSVRTTYQLDLLGDIQELLGRTCEGLGDLDAARTCYEEAARRFRDWHGNPDRAQEMKKKAAGLVP